MHSFEQLVKLLRQAAGEHTDPILTRRETAKAVGFSVTTLDRRVRDGSFPKPLQLSTRWVGWRLSTVNAWKSTLPEVAD